MATIVGIANTDLESPKLEEFIDKIGTAATTSLGLPPALRSVSFFQIPHKSASKRTYEEITFFVYSKFGKTVDEKRALVKNLQKTVDETFLEGPHVKTVVIIKEHNDENVGVDGTLKLDL